MKYIEVICYLFIYILFSQDEVHYTWGWSDKGSFQRVRTTPKDSAANNPAFDVTPADLITGIITEKGIIVPSEISSVAPLQK